MNYYNIIIFLFFLLLNSYSYNKLVYLEPKPDAKYVSTNNNIIIGFEKSVNLSESEIISDLSVLGSRSGLHSGKISFCENGQKIIFKPDVAFSNLEMLTINFKGKLLSYAFPGRKEYSYSFTTSKQKVLWDYSKSIKDEFNNIVNIYGNHNNITDIPVFTVTKLNSPSEGFLFIAPFFYATYLIIADNHGNTYWNSAGLPFCGDFKKQPSSYLTYYDGAQYKHFEMNQNYAIIDTFYCGNGYSADIHDLRVLPNGNAYLLAYDPQVVDMRQIVPGGDSDAVVIGLIIQEIDINKNVIFQWRSWDHFQITDAWHQNLDTSYIDCVHGNAIEIDNDSNLIISSRHLDEITKIDRVTGEIIWRFGGKNNQFTFIGDTLKFTYQHAVRRIANGNLTLYDNGNFHSPPHSRAIEYQLDEINRTATAVWQYRHTPDIFGSWGGYVQRLNNGNTLIAWGGTTPTITEVDSSGNIRFEGSYPAGVFTYRAYKFDWGGPPVSTGNNKNIIPSIFSLEQNYPNPFNPSTSIKFAVPKRGMIKLVIYDILGNEVRTLINEERNAGTYTINFDASTLSSGVYFYKMIAESFSETKKMILLK